ncbi:MAG: hypothetical protein ABWY64_11615 [Tardiphaga sp.]
MAKLPHARPAKAPVRAAGAPGAANGVVRKTIARKVSPKKAPLTKKLPGPKKKPAATLAADTAPVVTPETRAKRASATAARAATMAKTTKQVGDGPLVVDVHDGEAWEKANQNKARVIPDVVVNADDPAPESGAALVERVSRAVERELAQIEIIVGGGRVRTTQRNEAERRARTLASLARTLSEVRRLRATEDAQRSAYEPSEARDLDAFRKELWRRLEGMAARPADVPAAGDEQQ